MGFPARERKAIRDITIVIPFLSRNISRKVAKMQYSCQFLYMSSVLLFALFQRTILVLVMTRKIAQELDFP